MGPTAARREVSHPPRLVAVVEAAGRPGIAGLGCVGAGVETSGRSARHGINHIIENQGVGKSLSSLGVSTSVEVASIICPRTQHLGGLSSITRFGRADRRCRACAYFFHLDARIPGREQGIAGSSRWYSRHASTRSTASSPRPLRHLFNSN